MTELVRFGISIHRDLLERFDDACARKGYNNRSEAIRDLIRDSLVQIEWKDGKAETVGTVTLVYDHHVLDLPRKLTHIQHENEKLVVSTVHVHLDRQHCLEVLILRGPARKVKAFGEKLTSVRGIVHGKFTMTTTGRHLS